MIEWGDITALLALIERLRARAAAALGFNVPILCCYEAGYEGFWVYRLMTAAGHRVLIIDPASPLVNRRAKRAKTDRIDAKTMVRALMAFNRGEHQVLSAVNEEMDGSEETMIASLARIRGVGSNDASVLFAKLSGEDSRIGEKSPAGAVSLRHRGRAEL